MNEDALRLSDAERDAAAADLGEHYAQGRLSAEEHDERLSAVWAAKTRGELPGLFADLPSPFARAVVPPPPPAYAAPRRGRAVARGFHRLPPALRVVVGVLLALVVLTHLPLVLMAGLIWLAVTRSHGRPAWPSGHAGWHSGWQPRHHWR